MVLLCLANSRGNSTANDQAMAGIFLRLLADFTYAFYSLVSTAVNAGRGGLSRRDGRHLLCMRRFTYACASDDGSPLLATWNNVAAGIYMALVPVFLGYICYGYGLARISASMATTITPLEPVIAAQLAIMLVVERLLPLGCAGVGLIVVCLGIITVAAGKLSSAWAGDRKKILKSRKGKNHEK